MPTELEKYCIGIEFDVLVPAYLDAINDPFAKQLRKYLEFGAVVYNNTPNEFFVDMLKRAVHRNIMAISNAKRRMG